MRFDAIAGGVAVGALVEQIGSPFERDELRHAVALIRPHSTRQMARWLEQHRDLATAAPPRNARWAQLYCWPSGTPGRLTGFCKHRFLGAADNYR